MFLIRLCCDHATQLNIYCQQQEVTLVGQGVVVSVTERKNWKVMIQCCRQFTNSVFDPNLLTDTEFAKSWSGVEARGAASLHYAL